MKNKYDEALGEAFLKSAFKEAADLEFSKIDETDVDIKYPTDRQRHAIERAISKGRKTTVSRGWRAVAMIAIVFCLSFSAIMFQPKVRASVLDVFVTFFEDYLSINFGYNSPPVAFPLGDYTITYIPKEYGLVENKDTIISNFKSFSNGRDYIYIYHYNTPVGLSEDNTRLSKITIGDMNGYFLEYEEPESNNLVWGNENCHFSIKSTRSKEEMIKIAENIK